MKILKLLVAISIINAVVLVSLVGYGTKPVAPPLTTTIASPIPISNIVATTSPVATKAPTPKPLATKKPSTATPRPTAATTGNPNTAPAVTTTPAATTPTPTVAAATPTPVAGCVIQIDGVRYEITALRRSHSGGDIFQCGTDMSAIFWGRHNAGILSRMAAYKI